MPARDVILIMSLSLGKAGVKRRLVPARAVFFNYVIIHRKNGIKQGGVLRGAAKNCGRQGDFLSAARAV